MKKFKKLFLLVQFILFVLTLNCSYADGCHPALDASIPQYLIGYGSLMQTASKNSTYPNTGKNLPAIISGYQRGWFSQGSSLGFSTTYLGVIKNPQTHFNAAVFQLLTSSAANLYDAREVNYCRVLIPSQQITLLDGLKLPAGQFWMYVDKPNFTAKPTVRYPIVQSYVDIFLSGCLEMQQQYHLANFAASCIDTTSGWSNHWVNDRIYPRRPFIYQPNATAIDSLLAQKVPTFFKQITIE